MARPVPDADTAKAMTQSPDALAAVIADNAAETDEVADDRQQEFAARFYELLFDVTQRDPDMWEDAAAATGLDPEWLTYSLADLNAMGRADRTLAWQAATALSVAVAREQSFTEVVLRPLMFAAEGHAAAIKTTKTSTIRALAKTGVHKRVFEEAKTRRKVKRDATPTPV